ncbi:hypothetical protein SAMN05720781_1166 [Fibrobacter sp. UWT3]|uniref:hypothetical protein n=1 Tax=Fibrobacter sp. UWT3 TaxID=1896225 RepID=UPI000BC8ADE0|nr:hypothetical protein [Fibrobacter sp. UWT3]SOE56846.1 hypothetical protein SAMN05720781_1166 [Fibrobacter sp. UWT3]
MFYSHWKKIALTLTALFWAGCEDSASSAVCLYGPDPNYSSPAENPVSSSSETTKTSSSSVEESSSSSVDWSSSSFSAVYAPPTVFCTPMDSSVSYFPNDYSADNAKFWKEEAAKHDAVDKIDSIKQTLTETPVCLEHLRMELDRFVALYGAPTIINNAVESCSDGTTRPSEEYARFLKMKEEWEANQPALEEELKKVYEDKMKEIEERINKCLSGEGDK